MTKYLLRLDDACEYWNAPNWYRIEEILDRFQIKPLVGIIPACEDEMLLRYPKDESFWERAATWQSKDWEIALHGCNHRYETQDGGCNPVNRRSEFAGLPYEIQLEKIKKGYARLSAKGFNVRVFFAPSHTFDENTLRALADGSPIRVISDTVAYGAYKSGDFTFLPLQSGHATHLPLALVSFCYHPNIMSENDYAALERFLLRRSTAFATVNELLQTEVTRSLSGIDVLLRRGYYLTRAIRGK